MKRNMCSLLWIAVLVIGTMACKKEKKDEDGKKNSGSSNEVTDARDGKKYATVTIGNQTWLASSLKYTTATSLCPSGDCDTYGVYYNATDAKTACMEGYHLPSDEEWKVLEFFLGMLPADTGKTGIRGEGIGTKLKEGGSSGLNLKMSGFYTAGYPNQVATYGYYWSSTIDAADNTQSYYRSVIQSDDGVNRYTVPNEGGTLYHFCVRCLKN